LTQGYFRKSITAARKIDLHNSLGFHLVTVVGLSVDPPICKVVAVVVATWDDGA